MTSEEKGLIEENEPNQSFEDELEEWLQGYNDNSCKVSLYKYENKSMGARRALICQFEDEIPTMHQIGCAYGSGRYFLMVTIPKVDAAGKRPVKSYSFRIHETYDKYIQKDDAPKVSPMQETLQMMTAMIGVITPLINAMRPAQQGNPFEMIQPLIVGQAKAMQDMATTSIQNQMNTANELIKKQIDQSYEVVDDDETDDGNEGSGLLNQILPLVEQFLPQILGDKTGLFAKSAIGMVKNAPQFKQIVEDKNSYIRLISHLDEKYGSSETNKLLKMLKLKR